MQSSVNSPRAECVTSEIKGGKRGKRLYLKWTPCLEPMTYSKNHIQAGVTVLWSTQPCSVLAQGSCIKNNSKEKGSHYGARLVLTSKINMHTAFCCFMKKGRLIENRKINEI